jgi:DNA-binding response OmpR family regulator
MSSIFTRNRFASAGNRTSPSLTTCPTEFVAKGNLVVDWERGEICHQGGRRCKLSARETALLACLARKVSTPVSRDEILSQVWQLDPKRTHTRTVDMHISLLRRKLDADAGESSGLLTIYGVGYMLRRDIIPPDNVPPPMSEGTRSSWEGATGLNL